MLQEERGLADEETRERDGLYERAERLVSSLASIQDTLKEAIDDVNAGKLISLLRLTVVWQVREPIVRVLQGVDVLLTLLAVDRCCSFNRRPINSPWEGSAHPQQPAAGSDLCG